SLATGGAISIRLANATFAFSTRTSEPAGQWLGTADDDWHAVPRGANSRARWKGLTHQIERTITVFPDHVHVSDAITSSTDKVMGVIVEHRMAVGNIHVARRLLAGRKVFKAQQRRESPGNPTAIVESDTVA